MTRLKRFAPFLSLILFAAALWALHEALREHSLDDVVAELRSLSTRQIGIAMALTAVSYLLLIGYDLLALRHIGHRLPLAKVGLGSFVSYVFAHNIGFSLITGGSMRYRVYGAEGLSSIDIAVVTLLCGITFGLGASLLVGFALLVEPTGVLAVLPLPVPALRALGVVCLVGVFGYMLWTATRRGPIRFRSWTIRPPSLPLTLAQSALAVADIALASGALYVLLPSENISFLAFLGVFNLAIVAGVLSHVPGGLGVVETVMLTLLPGQPASGLLAALLAYRCLYYLVPLLFAGVLLAIYEAASRSHWLVKTSSALSGVAARLAPAILGSLVLLSGTVLLLSGATPGTGARIELLSAYLPLSIVEGSHLLGSLTGLALLILARGLFRRLDGAYYFTLFLLVTGIVFSLLKGLDYEEAILLAVVLVSLVLARQAFYRRSSIFDVRFSPAWVVTVAVLIGGSLWVGLFSYKEVTYAHDLWWQFAFEADAPRFLRASFLVIVAAVALALARLLVPARPRPDDVSVDQMERVRSIVAQSRATEANLALLGDKRFLFSDGGQAFIMYGVRGQSWIVMGDPVGPPAESGDLVWKFRELCDRFDGRPIFYEVGTDHLPIYIDLGLSLLKLGEEARVSLDGFSLAGSARKNLRYLHRRVDKEGVSFEVHAPQAVRILLPELRKVSDAWLREKKAREKAFSLGSFSPEYLCHFPCALVRHRERIVAFANIWLGADRNEMSIDLMRYLPDAPKGVMDYLIVSAMLWGREEGYHWFSLGMSPLSGLENHPLAPLWHRFGNLIFRNGENFYSFEGLRQYKEKFQPVWQPKYLACPGGLAVPAALLDVTTLISGRNIGIVGR